MVLTRPDLTNFAYPIHHLVNPEMFGKTDRVKCLHIPPNAEPSILTNDPKKTIKDVFKNSKTEILPINEYIHAIVDSYSITKGLPLNICATHFFRDYFYVYTMCALVYRPRSYFWITRFRKKK